MTFFEQRLQSAQGSRRTIVAAVGIAGLVAGALWGVVLSGWFNEQPRTWWWAFALAAATSAGLAALTARFDELTDLPETYYLRCLFASMPDWYNAAWRGQTLKFLGGDIQQPPVDGGLDVAEQVSAYARELQTYLNHAGSAERTLAPNLLWPMAMALGSQFESVSPLTLEELVDASVKQPISWKLGETPPRQCARPDESTSPAATAPPGAHLLVFDLSDAGTTSVPTQWHIAARTRVAFIDQVVADQSGWQPARPVRIDPEHWHAVVPETGAVGLHPSVAVDSLAGAIRKVAHDHPQAPIILIGRMPKTVAVAVGWRLAHPPEGGCSLRGAHSEGCANPWTRLVLLNWDRVNKRYDVVRAHPAQPSVADMLTRLAPDA